GDFEEKAVELAIDNQYDYVICGHIHQPCDKKVSRDKGSVHYLNSGDWIENLSWLEYNEGKWSLKFFDESQYEKPEIETKNINANLKEMVLPKEFAAFTSL
ncbi:MAG: UDP-2,3-diacylglucosamine diphosphatase, partial [Cruoricaptor ignavus]|nr:UDP-2,3-diacylglucosamine diphosphatase [Cruoricaptor ignavus]